MRRFRVMIDVWYDSDFQDLDDENICNSLVYRVDEAVAPPKDILRVDHDPEDYIIHAIALGDEEDTEVPDAL